VSFCAEYIHFLSLAFSRLCVAGATASALESRHQKGNGRKGKTVCG